MSVVSREPVDHVADERRWDAGCAGKDRYPSETAAEADLRRIKAEGRLHRACWLETYQCDDCTEWHIGNSRRVAK
jgi:hypothetical protein